MSCFIVEKSKTLPRRHGGKERHGEVKGNRFFLFVSCETADSFRELFHDAFL
jgi:hypothetical protein